MSAPHPVAAALDLLGDLVDRRAELSVGPVRIELPGSGLCAPDEVPAALLEHLENAAFLGLDWGAPPTATELNHAGLLAESFELYLDLRLPASGSLEPLPGSAAARTARVVFKSKSAHELLEQEALARVLTARDAVAGSVQIRLTAGSEELDVVRKLIDRTGRDLPGVALHLVPRDARSHDAFEAAQDALAQAARKASVTLTARGIGRWPFGPAVEGMLAWDIQHAFYRNLFKDRPSLCPFPFTMLSWDGRGTLRACPNPDGPEVGAGSDPWLDATALRRGFFESDLPPVCRRCTLYPRVVRSLRD